MLHPARTMETHSFHLVETTGSTQLTLYHRPDGQVLVPWKDIERAFPGVQPVRNGISVIKFLRGADYERINQCSRSMDVVLSTTVQSLPIKSSPAGDQANNPVGASVAAAEATLPLSATSVCNPDPLDTSPNTVSRVIASSGQIEAQVSRRAPLEARDGQQAFSILIPEEQESDPVSSDYRSSAKMLRYGYQEQELGELDQNIEASPVKDSKLQDEVGRLKKEVSTIVEAMKQLEKQVLGNQEEMKEQLQKPLPQLGVLRSRVQAILIQNYEPREYPISRLFAVLPQDPSSWDVLNPFSNKFRLYFLCECGEHTKSIKSTGPHEIHFAKHEGYEIARPSEFFQQYGHYILTLLKMLKARISVAGVTVPALSKLFPSDTIGKAKISLTHLRDNIKHGMDLMIGLMEKISVNEGEAVDEFAEHMEKKKVLEGIDLRKLSTFLKNKDNNKVLGNLYRIVTDGRHVKWVCIDHYRMNYQESSAKEFQRVLSSVGGSFSENDGRVVVKLGSSVLADQFYLALGAAPSVYELDIDLSWACTTSDLEVLEGALRNSRVSVLRLDLQQYRTSATSNQVPTPTQYGALFRIGDLPQVKSFHIVLSEENIEFPRISSYTSTHASKISCELKLRVIETGRMDFENITKALKTNSTLTTLDFNGNNISDDGTKALAKALRINSTLTTLNLYGNYIGDDGAQALAKALKINSTLNILNLSINNISDDGAKALAEALKINSTLTTLDLYDNKISDDGAKSLAVTLKINSTLTILDLSHNDIGFDGARALAQGLKINSALTALCLYKNNIVSFGAKALAQALKINSTLTTLDLYGNSMGDDGAEALAEALKINSTLTTLNLHDNNIGDDGAEALAEALKINSILTTLNSFDNRIGVNGAKALAEALKINSTLTTLDLNNNSIGEDGAEALAEALKINSILTTLNLYDNMIGVNGAKTMAEALRINLTLTTLDLRVNNISDDGAKALAEALWINSTLTTLNLNKNNIEDDGANALADSLRFNSTLTTLDLYDNRIGDDGAKALADALWINSTLTTLNLQCNSIKDDGAKALAEALNIKSTLTTLDLSSNNISDDGVLALAEALRTNSTLKILNLANNNIRDNGAKALADALKINSALTTLLLEKNEIGDDGAKALADALKITLTLATLDLIDNNIGVDGVLALAEALKINSNLTILH